MPRTRRGQPVDDWQVDGRAGRSNRRDDDWDEGHRDPDSWAQDQRQQEYAEPRGRAHQDQGHRDESYPPRRPGPNRDRRGAVAPPPPGAPPGATRTRRRRPRYGIRRFLVVLLLLFLVWVVGMIWALTASWQAIERVDATPDNANRPGSAAGTNLLLVGTDSRENLSEAERRQYKTGDTEGARADTIMLLHLAGGGGDPTLLSIPRDSLVEIPGAGTNKINAAYSGGGATLLVDTVEQATGLPLDGYVEIGFDGFVDVVGAVDGVRMCLPDPVFEERSDLDLAAGCQDLAGKDALNYVRMRYADPRGDLGRVERQRQFLASLVQRLTQPSTVLVPWRLHEAGTATGGSLRIGEETSMWEMGRVALAMRGISGDQGNSITVPVADTNYRTSDGQSTVLWDQAQAQELFDALRTDGPLTVEP